MKTKRCACCEKLFQPHPHIPNQTYCSSPACQRARKRQWQRNRLQSDPDYRVNQRGAQQAWQKRHPDYWRNYRDTTNGTPTESSNVRHPKLAKMDVSKNLRPGIYQLKELSPSKGKTENSWIVEITLVELIDQRKMDACKERT